MAPYNSDKRILGLHMLKVLKEARSLGAKLATMGGATAQSGLLNPELEDLEAAVNGLAQFEREIAVRGTAQPLDAIDVAGVLDAALGLMNQGPDVRDALAMSDTEAQSVFAIPDSDRPELPSAEQPAPDDSDPFAVPS